MSATISDAGRRAFERFIYSSVFGPGVIGFAFAWQIQSWELAAATAYALFVWSWRELVLAHWREHAPLWLRERIIAVLKLAGDAIDRKLAEWREDFDRETANRARAPI